MRAMVLNAPGRPLTLEEVPEPEPGPHQILVAVEACGVCRTDLHLLDGELGRIPYPVIPGHQVVGSVLPPGAPGLPGGARVGVPWLGSTCGHCRYCVSGNENLCDGAGFTGYTLPGGYAEYLTAEAGHCFLLDPTPPAAALAPLLCAGMIGYRALGFCGGADHIGLYGFGSAARLLAQILRFQGREFYAFTRAGDEGARAEARRLGAVWAGASADAPPRLLDAAIVFAPAGELVPAALSAVRKGGTVVCGGIHMSPIPEFKYELLWGERQLRSVANLTYRDGREFLELAQRIPIETKTKVFPLESANDALQDLRRGRLAGSAVLSMEPSK